MTKIRIRVIDKIYECYSCKKIKHVYISYKDKIYSCNTCGELYVATEDDIAYGNLGNKTDILRCETCGSSLKNNIIEYVPNTLCDLCNKKSALVAMNKDVLVYFYYLFSVEEHKGA